MLKRLLLDQQGQGMVEYTVLLALVSLALIGTLSLMRGSMANFFSGVPGTSGEGNLP